MNRLVFPLLIGVVLLAHAQTPNTPKTLKSVLLQEMRWTHNVKGGWFVPIDVAIGEITPEQAAWKDKSGNHSICELTNHLIFWDERNLLKFKGEQPPKFDGNNDESFHSTLSWDAAAQKIDQVLTDWEKAIEAADDAKLEKWHVTLANVVAHNAYHMGEIVYIRRQEGSWNPEKGVH